jgi:hypothetical protein
LDGQLKTGKHLWVPKSRIWTHITTQLAPVPVSACEYKHMRTQKMHELCDEYGSKLSTLQARLDVLDGLLLSIGTTFLSLGPRGHTYPKSMPWGGGLLTSHLETDFCSKPAGLASGLLLFQRLDRSL